MSNLTQRQLQGGVPCLFDRGARPKHVVEVAQYAGERELTINCTQLDGSLSAGEKKRVLSEWCGFLTENPTAFTSLFFGTRMPQELFDAVCRQQELKRLYVKWGAYSDLSAIAGLQKLEYLHLGSGAGVRSIAPLAQLKGLTALSVENFQKIADYRPLAALECLELLSIEGDGLSPRYIHLDSLEPLSGMRQLRSFSLTTAIVASRDYTPLLALTALESLSLSPRREVKALYDQLRALPRLKYGWLVEHPEFYR